MIQAKRYHFVSLQRSSTRILGISNSVTNISFVNFNETLEQYVPKDMYLTHESNYLIMLEESASCVIDILFDKGWILEYEDMPLIGYNLMEFPLGSIVQLWDEDEIRQVTSYGKNDQVHTIVLSQIDGSNKREIGIVYSKGKPVLHLRNFIKILNSAFPAAMR